MLHPAALAVLATLASAPLPVAAQGPAPPAAPVPAVDAPQARFDFAALLDRAQALAAAPHADDRPDLPPPFADLDYDRYRDIRFRRERALWRAEGLPFQVEMFPRGFQYLDRVRINVIEDGAARPLGFDPALFDYGRLDVPAELPGEVGYAGFRVLYPLHADDRFDEVAVFLGATYFRAVGQRQNYGISARGLAIDTGLPTREEFPLFREFWIERPEPGAGSLTVYALMDSPRATGAFRYVITPGLHTVIEVRQQVFMREAVAKIGIAPLTSMFWHGETTDRFMDDFRPEVHDSDGLVIENGTGERIWRPLVNPKGLRISGYAALDPRAFGLLQRDREFANYQDLEAHYHTRPSAVVEPLGPWGRGRIELVEIPSGAERYDNVVAFWVPEARIEAGSVLRYDYRLRFALDPEARLLGGRVQSTRVGAGGTDEPDPERRRFVVDFVGPALGRDVPDQPVTPVCSASSGAMSTPIAQANPYSGGWRVFFDLIPEGDEMIDLRCFLKRGSDVVSETWSFQWRRE